MKKVLFYCQHLLGIGHVTRSLSIVNELSKSFAVTYVQGGPEVPLRPVAVVKKVQLDPLLMRESDSTLYDPLEKRSVEEIFQSRKNQLSALGAFDAIVIELFPFGRRKFRKEVFHLLEEMKKKNSKVKVFCSVRDILVAKPNGEKRDMEVAEAVNKYFDGVWVHADQQLISFADTFSQEEKIRDKIQYTGFVAEPSKPQAKERAKEVLLSLGGGSVGEELYRAAIAVVPEFPEYTFRFVFGPYTSQTLRQELTARLANFKNRVEFCELLPNFEEELSRSALSLSMAGYNTVMNLVNTRTPALVLTYDANEEQITRARLLEKKGFLGVLQPKDLQPKVLAEKIRERLRLPYPEVLPDLKGTEKCRIFLEAAL